MLGRDIALIMVQICRKESILLLLHLLNVYLPYQCHDNYDDYVDYMGKLSAIAEGCTSSKLAIIGDFNAAVETTLKRNY